MPKKKQTTAPPVQPEGTKMKPPEIKTRTWKLEVLLPLQAHFVLECLPVLWFEKIEAYEDLLRALLTEYDPVSITETILVKDLADCHWELARLHKIKRAAFTSQLQTAAWKLMDRTFQEQIGQKRAYESKADIDEVISFAKNGSRDDIDEFKSLQVMSGVKNEELLLHMFQSGLQTLAAIETALLAVERRRTSLLKLIEQRKSTNSAISRAYLDGMMSQGNRVGTLAPPLGEDDDERKEP